MASSQYAVPGTPRVISPSPTPSEASARDSYFPSNSRSKGANGHTASPEPISENGELDGNSSGSDPELQRARSRSRSPQIERKASKASGVGAVSAKSGMPSAAAGRPTRRKPERNEKGKEDGHLSPTSAVKGYGSAYWRQLSRSPSPLGLIPIHREWRTFVSHVREVRHSIGTDHRIRYTDMKYHAKRYMYRLAS